MRNVAREKTMRRFLKSPAPQTILKSSRVEERTDYHEQSAIDLADTAVVTMAGHAEETKTDDKRVLAELAHELPAESAWIDYEETIR